MAIIKGGSSFLLKNRDDRLKSVQALRPFSKCQHYTTKPISFKKKKSPLDRTGLQDCRFSEEKHDYHLPS